MFFEIFLMQSQVFEFFFFQVFIFPIRIRSLFLSLYGFAVFLELVFGLLYQETMT